MIAGSGRIRKLPTGYRYILPLKTPFLAGFCPV